MKVFLGISLLIGGFVLVLVLRERSIDAAVAEDAAEVRPGWASVKVGRHSGAAPTQTQAPASPPGAPATPEAAKPAAPVTVQPETPTVREFEMTVQRGQTLSEICRAHYKTARPSLVEALARHNGLRDAGALREGAKLRLPPLETLEKR